MNNDTDFALEYYNDQSAESNLSIISLKVQNWPTLIQIADYYKDIMNTKDMLTSGDDVITEFDDE